MQIVIELDDKTYQKTVDYDLLTVADLNKFIVAIGSGTPLPKGHGRLIDADELSKDDDVTEWLSLNAIRTGKMLKRFSELFIKKINDAPTIIETDKTESEVEE